MANNFKPWVDTPTAGQQVQSALVFASDAQRVAGFTAGDPASALRVNSALRQANIVIAGLMQFCDEVKTLPADLSLLSTVTQVKNAIRDSIELLHDTTLTSAKSYTDTRETAIDTKIFNVQNQVTGNKDNITTLIEQVDEHDAEISALSGGSSTLTTRVETLETKVNTAPSTTQSNSTTTVPSDKLLKESSFARIYRSLSEVAGITPSTVTPVQLAAAMAQGSILIAEIIQSDVPMLYPSGSATTAGGIFVRKAGNNAVLFEFNVKIPESTTTYQYTGIVRLSDTGTYQWSGWVRDTWAEAMTIGVEATDLNTLIEDGGKWRATTTALVANCINKPESSPTGFVLECVDMRQSDTPYRTKMQTYRSNNGTWYRIGSQATSEDAVTWGNQFSDWKQIISTDNISTVMPLSSAAASNDKVYSEKLTYTEFQNRTHSRVITDVTALGLTYPTTTVAILNALVTGLYYDTVVDIGLSAPGSANITDLPDNYGHLHIYTPATSSGILRWSITYHNEQGNGQSKMYIGKILRSLVPGQTNTVIGITYSLVPDVMSNNTFMGINTFTDNVTVTSPAPEIILKSTTDVYNVTAPFLATGLRCTDKNGVYTGAFRTFRSGDGSTSANMTARNQSNATMTVGLRGFTNGTWALLGDTGVVDIGSSSFPFKDLYLAGNINAAGTITGNVVNSPYKLIASGTLAESASLTLNSLMLTENQAGRPFYMRIWGGTGDILNEALGHFRLGAATGTVYSQYPLSTTYDVTTTTDALWIFRGGKSVYTSNMVTGNKNITTDLIKLYYSRKCTESAFDITFVAQQTGVTDEFYTKTQKIEQLAQTTTPTLSFVNDSFGIALNYAIYSANY